MSVRFCLAAGLAAAFFLACLAVPPTGACCPAPPSGMPVVNADQTVIMIWDAATKTQHFIRQASFKSEAEDFGFLVPTPNTPELAESGNDAFPFLLKLTEPETKQIRRPSGFSCGCGGAPAIEVTTAAAVEVVSEALVAGFHAVVLKADSADDLVDWLRDHGYAYSPEIQAWAQPYVDAGWKITALKVAKNQEESGETVAASALRLSFQTDRPLFPYREPDTSASAAALGARSRLLRIYFLADGRYEGTLTKDVAWTGNVAWSGELESADRSKLLNLLALPESTGPDTFWLTEFEDEWPYRVAPADLYFSRDANQNHVERDPIIEYASTPWPAEVVIGTVAFASVFGPRVRRFHRRRRARA